MSELAQKEPCRLTASDALPLLRTGQLTVEGYVRSCLARIKQRDEQVRAWCYLDPDKVISEARRLDAIPVSERGPLFGLPVGVKDVILTKNMPTQYNSRLYKRDDPISVDANVVLTFRASGALIFGKTTTTEFAASKQGGWHQNLTKNSQDPKRTPGGSSSGSGAAVADYQIPVAIGTQTGGSIIRPASFNGCYGWKPTWGAISREGLAQWCPTLDTCGFFARSVQDLEILADVLRVRDDEAIPEAPFELAGARIGFYRTSYWPNAGTGTINAMQKASEILRRFQCAVEDLQLPSDFDHILKWHADVLSGEGGASFLGQYLTDKALLHEDLASYVENSKKMSRKQLLDAYDNCARLRPIWDRLAGEYDAIITPSVPDEAPLGLESTGDMSFCSPWTILHVPAVNIPGFTGENSMPIGLTAVTARFRDRHLLRVVAALGQVFLADSVS